MAELDNNKELIDQLSAEGDEYYNNEEFDKALESYNKILKIDPNNAKAYYNRGFTYNGLEQYDEALKDYDTAITLEPNNTNGYHSRGFTYNILKQYDKALKNYNKAIELNPNHKHAYNNRGTTYGNLEQYDEALKDFDKAIELNPNEKYAYNNKVMALKATKNGDVGHDKKIDEDIISCYKLAIKNNPLDKRYYDFLQSFYKDSKLTIPATQVERDYYKALQENDDKNKKNTDDLQNQIKELQELKDTKKISQVLSQANKKSNEITTLIENVEESNEIIKTIESDIQARYELLKKQYDHLENDALAEHYQIKANRLETQLNGENSWWGIGYTQSFWAMLLLDIGIIFAFSFLFNSESISFLGFTITPQAGVDFWENFAVQSMRFSPMFILLVWGTRYFNRRIHETIHLIEEYEHKAIVLRSFEPYSERIQKLGNPEILAKYTEKVSHIITESPTNCLTRKKTDKLPIELIQALKSPVNLTIPKT